MDPNEIDSENKEPETKKIKIPKNKNLVKIEFNLKKRNLKECSSFYIDDVINEIVKESRKNKDEEDYFDDEDILPDQDKEANLTEFIKKYPKLEKSLNGVSHGDAIFFDEYRGVGLWLVEEQVNGKIKIHKTWGEYGNCVPLQLSDLPPKYYNEIDTSDRLIYAPCVLKDSPMGKFLKREIEKIKKEPKFVGKLDIDYEKNVEIDLSIFPQGYFYFKSYSGATWVDWDSGLEYWSQDPGDDNIQKYLKRTIGKWEDFCDRAYLITRLVAKHLKIPKGVAEIIAHFLIGENPYLSTMKNFHKNKPKKVYRDEDEEEEEGEGYGEGEDEENDEDY